MQKAKCINLLRAHTRQILFNYTLCLRGAITAERADSRRAGAANQQNDNCVFEQSMTTALYPLLQRNSTAAKSASSAEELNN